MIVFAGDVGGTAIKLGLVEDNQVLARGRLVVGDRSRFEPLLDALHDARHIDQCMEPFLGGEDPIFGFMAPLTMQDLIHPERLRSLQQRVAALPRGLVLVVGEAASAVHDGDVLVYADMQR